MNILAFLGSLLGTVPKAVGDYLTERLRTASAEKLRDLELKDAVHRRQIELISQGLAADAQWESIMANQAASSWKDEYTLIVISIPAVMAFIPGLAGYVAMGFTALSGTPYWYQITLVSLFMATFGIRYWRRSQYDTESPKDLKNG